MIFTIITEQEKKLPIYITGTGTQENEYHILRQKGFNNYQITFCTKGEGLFIIDDKEYKINAGSGFFFSPHIPHEYYPTKEPWETNWITFNGNDISLLLETLNVSKWEVFRNPDEIDFLVNFYKIHSLLASDNPKKVYLSSPLIYSMLIDFQSRVKIDLYQPNNNKIKQLEPVIQYLESNYGDDVSLEDMASVINITPHHLCKLFKAAFSITPFNYFIKIRLKKAKELLLKSPNLKIHEISKQLGYTDTSYFCSIFKKQEHLSPLEFRRAHGV